MRKSELNSNDYFYRLSLNLFTLCLIYNLFERQLKEQVVLTFFFFFSLFNLLLFRLTFPEE